MDNLPVGARWVPYCSFIKWTFEALAQVWRLHFLWEPSMQRPDGHLHPPCFCFRMSFRVRSLSALLQDTVLPQESKSWSACPSPHHPNGCASWSLWALAWSTMLSPTWCSLWARCLLCQSPHPRPSLRVEHPMIRKVTRKSWNHLRPRASVLKAVCLWTHGRDLWGLKYEPIGM